MWIGPKEHKAVGACLETVRRNARMTQQELARRLGKPQSFVSSYESGQRRIDVLEFIRIVSALGDDPGTVFASILDLPDKEQRRTQ